MEASARRLPVLAGFGRRWSAGAIHWPGPSHVPCGVVERWRRCAGASGASDRGGGHRVSEQHPARLDRLPPDTGVERGDPGGEDVEQRARACASSSWDSPGVRGPLRVLSQPGRGPVDEFGVGSVAVVLAPLADGRHRCSPLRQRVKPLRGKPSRSSMHNHPRSAPPPEATGRPANTFALVGRGSGYPVLSVTRSRSPQLDSSADANTGTDHGGDAGSATRWPSSIFAS